MNYSEANEILDEDLDAASEYYDRLLKNTSPPHQAKELALEKHGIEIDDATVNRIMGHYACTPDPLERSVEYVLRSEGLI